MTVYDLERNDLAAAKKFVRERGDALTVDEGQVLLMLQDDPTELRAWMRKERSRPSRR